jgi:hypothetical protein
MGRWKAVQRGLAKDADAAIELYDLEADPGESRDLAVRHPEVVDEARRLWRERSRSPVAAWNLP